MEFFPAALYTAATPRSWPRQATTATTTIPAADLPHDNQAPQLNFTIWLLTGLSLGFLSLRVYCKFLRGRGLWWDDYVLITSWVSLALASGFTTASTTFGYGKHLWDIPDDNFFPLNVVATFAGTFSILAAVWSKTSFAMTVLRISTGWMRWAIWFIILSVNVVLSTSAIFQWIRCMPVQKIFDGSRAGECWPQDVVTNYNTFSTAYSGAMDIALAVFPWKIIWGMSMNHKEKLGVLFAMSMGVFAGVASLIKVSKVRSLTDPDPSDTVQLVIWGVAESAITIIAASIPILRALLRDDKMSNAPQTEAQIELNTGNWNRSTNFTNMSALESGTSRIQSGIPAGATGAAAATTTTTSKAAKASAKASTKSSAASGAPSWVIAPVTITSANWDYNGDSRPVSTEIPTGNKSLI